MLGKAILLHGRKYCKESCLYCGCKATFSGKAVREDIKAGTPLSWELVK